MCIHRSIMIITMLFMFIYWQITKQQVDRFCIFHNHIPKCEFFLHWVKGTPTDRLLHRIDLMEGTANGKKHFLICFLYPHDRSGPTLVGAHDHQNFVLQQATIGSNASVSEQTECQGDSTQGKINASPCSWYRVAPIDNWQVGYMNYQ